MRHMLVRITLCLLKLILNTMGINTELVLVV